MHRAKTLQKHQNVLKKKNSQNAQKCPEIQNYESRGRGGAVKITLVMPVFELQCVCRICLVCRQVFCSRYVNEHMVGHNSASGHELAISMADLSVWCYACDYYVDNAKLFPAKNALHKSKFGEEMPQSDVDSTNPQLEIA